MAGLLDYIVSGGLLDQPADGLIPPPRHPGMLPEWWNQGVRGVVSTLDDMANLRRRGVSNVGGALGHAAVDAVTLPRHAMEQGITTEEAMPWARDMTLNMAGFGTPFAAKNTLGIFGGRNAVTADQQALKLAEDMAGKGASRDDIWNKTGWFQGVDGKWRFEIPDDKAALTGKRYMNAVLEKDMTHPEAFAAYPDTKSIGMLYGERPNSAAYYNGPPEKIGVSSLVPPANPSHHLHELQHAIQWREGFAPGSSPKLERQLAPETGNKVVEQLRTAILAGEYGGPGDKAFTEAARNLLALERQHGGQQAMDTYKKVAGEVESRNVQSRMNMTPEERRATPPWKTQDVPDEQQIVRFGSSGPQMSIDKLPQLPGTGPSPGVAGYVQQLKNAGTDKAAFDPIFSALSADRALKKGDIQDIMKGYGYGTSLSKTREGALKEIFQTWVERARFENKLRAVRPPGELP